MVNYRAWPAGSAARGTCIRFQGRICPVARGLIERELAGRRRRYQRVLQIMRARMQPRIDRQRGGRMREGERERERAEGREALVSAPPRPNRAGQPGMFAPRKPPRSSTLARVLRPPCMPALSRETTSYRVTHRVHRRVHTHTCTYIRTCALARLHTRVSKTPDDERAIKSNLIESRACARPVTRSRHQGVAQYSGHIADEPARRRARYRRELFTDSRNA